MSAKVKLEEAIKNAKSPKVIDATPWEWTDGKDIEPRDWVYYPYYCREYLCVCISTGGIGKSTKLIADAIAMATGQALLGIKPNGKLRVWYFNAEDSKRELDRRVAATCKHYGIKKDDLDGRLFVNSGHTMPIKIATTNRGDTKIAVPIRDAVIAAIRKHKIDVLIIDPFVSTHEVSENDNGAIDLVAKTWAYIASETKTCIVLVHHTRKPSGEALTVDDGRGASALVNAARVNQVFNTMREKEAEDADIDESERRSYVRVDIGKTNLTKHAEDATWFYLESVDLENARDFGEDSDHIGVATPWTYPQVETPRVDANAIARIHNLMEAGGPWRSDQRANDWIGYPIAQALLYEDPKDLSGPNKRKIVQVVKDGLKVGWLKKSTAKDRHSKVRPCVIPGTSVSGGVFKAENKADVPGKPSVPPVSKVAGR